MRHAYFGKKLSRTTNERKQLFRNLSRALIRHGSITTTITKAKAVQPMVEKLITKATAGSESKRREVYAMLADSDSTAMLMEMAKTRFTKRTSGFTRIIKLGFRSGDATETAQLSFVDGPVVITPTEIVPAKGKAVPSKKVEPSKVTKKVKKAGKK